MKKTSPRTNLQPVALPAPPTTARAGAERVPGRLPPTRRRLASRVAAAAPIVPTTRAGCSAAPGSPPDRRYGDRPALFERHGVADARPDDDPRPNQPTWR